MTPDQWSRVKDIFNAALERDPDARRAFVAEASAGDQLVQSEVERLLDAQHESSAFIERPAADTLLSGRTIGHYEIGRLIGTGGMGHVYAARDVELGRDVALKVASFDGEDAAGSPKWARASGLRLCSSPGMFSSWRGCWTNRVTRRDLVSNTADS